jgi:hypothetical protein
LEIYNTNNTVRIKIRNNTTEERIVNQCVRQGCPLSQTLFNIYKNEIKHWNEKYITAIKISNDTIKYHIICR